MLEQRLIDRALNVKVALAVGQFRDVVAKFSGWDEPASNATRANRKSGALLRWEYVRWLR